MKFSFKIFHHYSYLSYIHCFLMLTLANCITAEKSCTTNNRFELFNCTIGTVPLVLIDCNILNPNNCLLGTPNCFWLNQLINGGNNGQKPLKKMNTNLFGQNVQDRSVSPCEATPRRADHRLSQRYCKFVACRKKVRINLIKLVDGNTICPQFFKRLFGSQLAILVISKTSSMYRSIGTVMLNLLTLTTCVPKLLKRYRGSNMQLY